MLVSYENNYFKAPDSYREGLAPLSTELVSSEFILNRSNTRAPRCVKTHYLICSRQNTGKESTISIIFQG